MDEIRKEEVVEPVEVVEAPAEVAEEEIEVSDDVIEKVADKVIAGLNASKEKVMVKNIAEVNPEKSIGKEMKMFGFVKGLVDGVVKGAVAGMMDETDTSVLLPPAEFTADVQKLQLTYGVALRDCYVRQTQRTSVLINRKTSDVIVYDTAEGAKKTVTSMAFDQVTITLRKFAALAPLSDELLEDSAVDLYAELTDSFARAFAKVADELVFTDATTGILKVSGTNVITMASAKGFADVTFDNLVDMVDGIYPEAQNGAKFYFHRSHLATLRKLKSTTTGDYLWAPGVNGGVGATLWGYPYELVEVMPTKLNNAPSTAFMIFGNLKYVTLLERTQIQLTTLREGTIGSVNLGEQDATALRAVKRFNATPVFPSAFSVLKTNTTVS